MSDKKEGPEDKPDDAIDKPLDAAKRILFERQDYRDMRHDPANVYFDKITKIVQDEFNRQNPNPG